MASAAATPKTAVLDIYTDGSSFFIAKSYEHACALYKGFYQNTSPNPPHEWERVARDSTLRIWWDGRRASYPNEPDVQLLQKPVSEWIEIVGESGFLCSEDY